MNDDEGMPDFAKAAWFAEMYGASMDKFKRDVERMEEALRRVPLYTTQELQEQVKAQQKWIQEHGGCMSGYLDRYPSPEWDGAAIYVADVEELMIREARYADRVRGVMG